MLSHVRRLAGFAAALGLAGLAATPLAAARPTDEGQVAQVCAHTVGLMAGERHYAACVASLSRSLASLDEGERNAAARRHCLERGLQPSTPALAECVLTSASGERLAASPASDAAPTPGGARSYFVVSRQTAIERDKLACARLGFDPAGEAFGACVADLRAALARASEPSM